MPIITSHLTIDRSKLPSKSDKLRVLFKSQLVNRKNNLLVIYPNAEPGFEPAYARYVTAMKLQLSDGTVAQMMGQIVVTGQRLIGMITDGSVGKAKLNEAVGSIYAFAIDLDDIRPVETKKNWRGKPIEATIRSKESQSPAFLLHIIGGTIAMLKNDGNAAPTTLEAFLERLTPEGRRNLQKQA